MKTKIFILNILLSLFCSTSIYLVKIYDSESRYQLFLTWSSRSITNHYEFYLIPFLCNFTLCFLIFSLLTLKIKKNFNQHLLYFPTFIILTILILYSISGYFVFDTQLQLFEPERSKLKEHSHLYCRYPAILDHQSLRLDLCGRGD